MGVGCRKKLTVSSTIFLFCFLLLMVNWGPIVADEPLPLPLPTVAGSAGFGDSAGELLELEAGFSTAVPPTDFALISPDQKARITTSNGLVFTWSNIAGAKWYRFHLTKSDGTKIFKQKYRDIAVICSVSTCSLDLSYLVPTLAIDRGYRWWVIAKIQDGEKLRTEPSRFKLDGSAGFSFNATATPSFDSIETDPSLIARTSDGEEIEIIPFGDTTLLREELLDPATKYIYLLPDDNDTPFIVSVPLSVIHDIVIYANNARFVRADNGMKTAMFHIGPGDNVEIHHIRIIGARNYSNYGGGISNSGNLSLFDSQFTGNYAYNGGGAIFNRGDLKIFRSEFKQNMAGAGGVQLGGGAGIQNDDDGNLEVECSRFILNSAGYGSGILNGNQGSNGNQASRITVRSSAFYDNTALIALSGADIHSLPEQNPYPQVYSSWWGEDNNTPSVNNKVVVHVPGMNDPTIAPECTPVEPRIVAAEAVPFHIYAKQFGLPMPFDILPVPFADLDWVQGYGANTFTWKTAMQDVSPYKGTHGYHTGLDFGGLEGPKEVSIPVQAVCDGVILAGRVSGGNGGSTKANTGYGFILRCFADDPTLFDPDDDGHRNLSNIAMAYNHVMALSNRPFPLPGEIVHKGELLAQTTHYYTCYASDNCTISNGGINCNVAGLPCSDARKQPNHLHFEVFIARGFRDGLRHGIGGDGGDAIRINPDLVFSLFTGKSIQKYLGPFYPIRRDFIFVGSVETLEAPPIDFNDADDFDFGIYEGDLGSFIPAGEITRPEQGERLLFWTRENTSNSLPGVQKPQTSGPEWTLHSLSNVQTLVTHLLSDNAYSKDNPFIGTAPHCSNVAYEIGNNLPNEDCSMDGSVQNDDADLNIGGPGAP